MNEWIALGASFVYIFLTIGIAQVLLTTGVTTASVTRKIVHIGVAHWYVIALIWFETVWVALIGPVSFIAINAYSYRAHLFRAMEHAEPRRNLGTIYFPVALTAVVALAWTGVIPRWFGLTAILTLGWGDGLASLVGESWGRRPGAIRITVAGGTKSVAGTLAMAFGAAAVSAVTLALFSGPFVGAPGAGGRAVASLADAFRRLGALPQASPWMAQPSDSIVVQALAALDGVVRIAAERAITLVALDGVLPPGSLFTTLSPTTIAAIVFIVVVVATTAELMTPWGLDNITIPVAVVATLTLALALPAGWTVRLAWAIGLNVAVAVGAYIRKSVTIGGSVAGALVGAVIYLSGGVFAWSVLMAFFVSSTLLSRVGRTQKEAIERRHAKGSRRDAVQVLANGGLAALLIALHSLTGRPIFLLGFGIAMAASNADTWASEIGSLSPTAPVSVIGFRPLPAGTSGGVSALGILASLAGGLFIALWFAVAAVISGAASGLQIAAVVAAITGGGFVGSILDSVLGATVQAQYRHHATGELTERPAAGRVRNELVRGWAIMTNDAVNALSGLSSVVLFALVVG